MIELSLFYAMHVGKWMECQGIRCNVKFFRNPCFFSRMIYYHRIDADSFNLSFDLHLLLIRMMR